MSFFVLHTFALFLIKFLTALVLPHDIGKEETRYQPQKSVFVSLLIEHSSIIMEIELLRFSKMALNCSIRPKFYTSLMW